MDLDDKICTVVVKEAEKFFEIGNFLLFSDLIINPSSQAFTE